MTRKLYWPILLIGFGLIVAPFVISLPTRASAGQKMINNFRPMMQQSSVDTAAQYYNQTFLPLASVAAGGSQAAGEVPNLIGALATQLKMSPAQVQQFLQANFPAMSGLLTNLPKLVPVFKQVPPGLAFYKPLVDTMQANVGNYAKIDSLPNFTLFTWFFEIPGVLIVLLSAAGLIAGRRESTQ